MNLKRTTRAVSLTTAQRVDGRRVEAANKNPAFIEGSVA